MESASVEPPQNRFVVRGQPLQGSKPRKKNKKKQVKAEDEYFLKDILQEEYRNGELYYLIDWAGTDSQTGKPYDPSWEPAGNANKAAIEDWENTKKREKKRQETKERKKRKREKTTVAPSNSHQDQSQESQIPSSQPIRPAKRKRPAQPQQSSTPERAAKKPNRKGPSSSVSPQPGSKHSPGPQQASIEIEDTYNEELPSSTHAPVGHKQKALVEIPPPPTAFNPGEYQLISSSPASQKLQNPQNYSNSANSSQRFTFPPPRPLQHSSPPSQLFLKDDIQVDSSATTQQPGLYRIPSKRRLVFLEDDIEDTADPATSVSQDLHGSSSYQVSTAPVLSAESPSAPSAPNPDSNTQADQGTGSLIPTDEDSSQVAEGTSTSESYPGGSSSYRPSTGHPQESESIGQDSNTQAVAPESLEESAQEPKQEILGANLTLSSGSFEGSGFPTYSEAQTGPQEHNTSPASVERNPFDRVEGHISDHQIESPGTTPDRVQTLSSSQGQLPLLEDEGSYSEQNSGGSLVQSQYIQSGQSIPQSSGKESSQRTSSKTSSSKVVQPPQHSTQSKRCIPNDSSTIPLCSPLQTTLAVESLLPSSTSDSEKEPQPEASPNNSLVRSPSVHTPGRRAPQGSGFALASLPSINILPSIEGTEDQPSPGTPPSRASMDAAPVLSPPGQDARVLLRESRLRAIARKQAERAARSASTITLPGSPPPLLIPDAPLPLREVMVENPPPMPVIEPAAAPHRASPNDSPKETPLNSRKHSPEPDLEDVPEDDTTTSLSIPPLGLDEYIIPMPLVAQTRDVYVQTIRNNKQERLAFLEGDSDNTVAMKIDEMLDDLAKLCDHQDLILEEDYSTQRAALIEHQSNYAQTISTKCIFIAELVISLRASDKHLVILSRSGRMREILESLLNTNGFGKSQGGNTFFDTYNGSFRVSILSSDGYNGELGRDSASIVVAFSPVSDIVSYSPIRASPTTPSQLAPFVSLVISHSIEHLNLCFDKNLMGTERNVQLVTCLSQIQDYVGKLSAAEWPSPPKAAKDVAKYLMSDMEGMWPIPEMPIIEDIEVDRFSSQPGSTYNQEPSGSTTQSYNDSSAGQFALPLPKRQLIKDDADDGSPKRQRLSPLPDEQLDDSGITHISSTTGLASSAKFTSQLPGNQVATQRSAANGDIEMGRAAALQQKVDDLERELRLKDATEAKLRSTNQTLDEKCRRLESDINEKIEPKFREALDDRSHFESEITKSLQDQDLLRKIADAKNDDAKKYKEERDRLLEELKQTQVALSSSSNPEIAEFNKLKDQIRDLQTDLQRAEKRRLNAVNEGGFFQNQYQALRSDFDDSNFEKKELEKEVALLRIKAADNAVRIHEIYNSSEIQQHLNRIRELTAENKEYERELKRRDDELKAMAGGRRGTRGTSVPRSPRIGAGTMSQGGVRERAIGGVSRVIAQSSGPRSRGTSPATGEFSGRQFGGELFQGSSGPGRWGHHLQ